LVLLVAALALICVGAAGAAGGLVPGEETSTTDLSSPESTASTEATLGDDESTDPGDATTETTDELVSEEEGTGDTGDADDAVHPDNFGRTISSMRAAGDHTPAAVVMGKKVPGYYKKMSTTTEPDAGGGTPPSGE
jgi:hypothetical protein